MTSPNRRLARAIESNLRTDLVAQAGFLAVGVFWLRSPWIFALWAIRWVVIAAIVMARRAIRRYQRREAVLVLAAGHFIGALGTVAIIPEFAPLVMVVLFGDVLLATYLDRQTLRPYLMACVGVAAATGLLSQQSWIGLVDQAERWLVVVVIVSHTVISGTVISQSGREGYNALRVHATELRRLRERLHTAHDNERRSIEHDLTHGAVSDLDALGARLHTIEVLLDADPVVAAAAANEAATEAQRSLTSLRRLSHGIFPDALRLYGLRTAFGSLAAEVPVVDELSVIDDRFEPAIESAVYASAAEIVRLAVNGNAALRLVVSTSDASVRLGASLRPLAERSSERASEPVSEPAELSSQLVDRIGAVGGEVDIVVSTAGIEVIVEVPRQIRDRVDDITQPDKPDGLLWSTETERDSDRRILTRFVAASTVLGSAGLVITLVLWLATRLVAAALVLGVLVVVLSCVTLAWRAVHRDRFVVALTLLCVEACVAGLAVTAIVPEFVSVAALITVLPMVLALPYLRSRSLNVVAGIQTLALTGVTLIGVLEVRVTGTAPPTWLTTILVPTSAVGVAVLVALMVVETHAVLSDRTESLTRSLAELVTTADNERQRIERDLHDGAQQHFVALSMQLRVLARLAVTDEGRAHSLLAALTSEIDDARHGVLDVAAGSMFDVPTFARVRDALERIGTSIPLTVVVDSPAAEAISPDVALQLYYCCREAVQNAVKHAGPDASVTVRLRADRDGAMFEISDTGCGFDEALVDNSASRGLRSLRERIEIAGGVITVSSSIGSGTTVSGRIPMPGPLPERIAAGVRR